MAFVKLHGTILDSSIWLDDHPTRLLWITMLVMADERGVVQASVGGLAARARITREECEAALAKFLGPDPDSRDQTSGERIERVPGGWLILNHANYRDKQTRQQALTAARVARHREKHRRATGNDVAPDNATSPSEAEAEAEAEVQADPDTPPTPGGGVPVSEATAVESVPQYPARDPSAIVSRLTAAKRRQA